MSLMATGMPCSGPSVLPLRRCSSSVRACASASSRIEVHEGVHLVVDRFDPLQTGADILFRAHVAVGDPLGGFDGGQSCRFDVKHQ